MIEIMQYMCKYDKVFLLDLIRKKRFPVGKTKLVWEASLRCNTFC